MLELRFVLSNLVLENHVKSVDLRSLKFPCRNLPLKEQVDLREGPAGGLGKSEVVVDNHEETGASPEESCEVAPVPRCWVDHVWGQHVDHDRGHVVRYARQSHCLDLEPTSRHLGHQ